MAMARSSSKARKTDKAGRKTSKSSTAASSKTMAAMADVHGASLISASQNPNSSKQVYLHTVPVDASHGRHPSVLVQKQKQVLFTPMPCTSDKRHACLIKGERHIFFSIILWINKDYADVMHM